MSRRPQVLLPAALLLLGLVAVFALPLFFSARQRALEQRLFARLDPFAAAFADLQTAMLNMETGERGYLLTGDARFLEPYQQGQQVFQDAAGRAPALARAVGGDSPAQLAQVLAAATVWQQQTADLVDLRRAGALATAGPLDQADAGKTRFDQYRQTLAPLSLTLSTRRAQTRSALSTAEQQRTLVVSATGLLVLVLGLVCARIVWQRFALLRTGEQATTYQHHLLDSLRDLVVVVDAETSRLLEVNQATVEATGYHRRELLALTAAELRVPEERSALPGAVAAALQTGGTTRPYPVTWLAKDGTRLPLEFVNRVVELAGRTVLIASGRDISERQRSDAEIRWLTSDLERRVAARTAELATANQELAAREQALRASEERLARIIETMAESVSIIDREGRFVLANAATTRVMGIDRAAIVGTAVTQPGWRRLTLAGEPFPAADHPFAALQRSGASTYRTAFVIERAAGDRTTLEVHAAALRDAAGTFDGIVVLAADITARERAAQELEQARAEAERANRAKSEFLSRMSHELRTPLNAILGFAQLLELDVTGPEQLESVTYILTAGRHLLDLINEVLDIARIEAGRLPLSPEPVCMAEVAREVLQLMQPLAQQRQLQLALDDRDAATGHVVADRQRLKQVLLNLLSNAVKYTPSGGRVTVALALTGGPQGRITVTDTGPGIAAADLPRLFSPFERLQADATEIEGTGLGLTLCKRLVEAMAGSIGVRSVPGEGSSFWVAFPGAADPLVQDAPVPGEAAVVLLPAGRARTLLYIEDNLSNYRLIERVLAQRPDLGLLPAMQGRLGLALAREHQPAAILLDLHLPDISGEQVLAQLQGQPQTAGIPVIVVSADATPGQVERLRAAGAYAYLTKPLDIRHFLGVLDAAVEAA